MLPDAGMSAKFWVIGNGVVTWKVLRLSVKYAAALTLPEYGVNPVEATS